MTAGLLLGLDVGGSFVKASVVDLGTGQTVTRGKAVPVLHPAPGHNERDARFIWHQTAEITHQVMDLLPAGSRIAAVGVTGHGNGLYLVDRKGRPTRRAVMASDTRAVAQVRTWLEAGVHEELAPLTWNGLWPGQPGPILAWLQQNDRAAVDEAAYALMCKDFIRAQLTGEVGTELTDQSCCGLFDNRHGRHSAEVLAALGIEEQERLLVPPSRSTDVVGYVTAEATELTGIPSGTPVVAGVVDNVALHLGSGVLDSSSLCVAAGTWSVNQLLVPREEMVAGRRLGAAAPFAACTTADARAALLIDASPTSASTLAWALEHAITGMAQQAEKTGSDVFELALRRVAALTPGMDDPFFVPYLDGSRTNPGARGAWLNLSSWNGEDNLVGAVVEGVCMEHRRHVDRLSAAQDRLPLRLSGGAAKSASWAQRFADITGRDVEVSASQELGALGAAIVAGVGVGTFDDLRAGAAAIEHVRAVFRPDDGARTHYEARYARYCDLSDWVSG